MKHGHIPGIGILCLLAFALGYWLLFHWWPDWCLRAAQAMGWV